MNIGDPVTIADQHSAEHALVISVFLGTDGAQMFSWKGTGIQPWYGTRQVDAEGIEWCRGHVAGVEARALLAASALAD